MIKIKSYNLEDAFAAFIKNDEREMWHYLLEWVWEDSDD